MKGKSKYIVLLLLLLVVCGGMVTYAIYKTNKSGNATVNAARWNVVFKNGESEIENNFNIQLSNATWTNPLGSVASGKIAPGSSATFYITIDATNTETSVDYTAEIEDSFNETDFDVTLADDSGTIPYSTTSGAMIRQIPIQVVWNGNINDSNTKNNDDLLKKARDITIPIKLTAAQKLALKYTVTFNDGAGNIISSKKVDEGSSIGTLPENPTRIGYTFAGWYDATENGNEVTTETEATQGMQIYAHWDVKFVRVTFDSNGGSNVIPREIQEGRSFPDVPTTTKDGSELIGWFDENDNQLTTSTIIMNNITYTAMWQEPLIGRLVYYDPVTNNECNASTYSLSAQQAGTSTCYAWRALSIDSNENVTMQKTFGLITSKWSNSYPSEGPIVAMDNLATATSTWTRVPLLNYSYNDVRFNLSCVSGECTMPGGTVHNARARLLTLEEYNSISQTCPSGWCSWFYENLVEKNPPYGSDDYYYPLLTSDDNTYVTVLVYQGYTLWKYPYYESPIRPVITVPKSDLN